MVNVGITDMMTPKTTVECNHYLCISGDFRGKTWLNLVQSWYRPSTHSPQYEFDVAIRFSKD